MKKITLLMLILLSMSILVSAQNSNSNATAEAASSTANSNTNSTTAKRPPVFRATKEQITQAQTMLKQKNIYSGEATGKLDDSTRTAIKKFQESEKIRATGTLNRLTLEKMGVQLTDKQKLIPISESSKNPDASDKSKSRSPVFRATKDQIMQAQKMLKDKNLYNGAQDGKMSDEFCTSLKKYQEMEKIKAAGTLNRETLEKMGIQLTDAQKGTQTTAAKTQ
jgi:peptidoglycan hydrolase-like protein with peptidoglycan-binding domain